MKYSTFLKENYQVLLEIFNGMRIGVWITDSAGTVLMVNDESLKAGGLRRDEIIGRKMTELIDIGYVMESSALNAIREEKEEMVIEELGEGGYCVATSVPLKWNGKIDIVVCVERDISEVIKLRNALQQNEDMKMRIEQAEGGGSIRRQYAERS